MGVIVDTSVWVGIERGILKPVDVAGAINNDFVFTTPTILAELQYGVERATTSEQRNLRFNAMSRLRGKPCLTIDKDTGMLFGRLSAELDASGTPSKHRLHDLWIAAVAVQQRMAVLTRNPSDFADMPGLRVVPI